MRSIIADIFERVLQQNVPLLSMSDHRRYICRMMRIIHCPVIHRCVAWLSVVCFLLFSLFHPLPPSASTNWYWVLAYQLHVNNRHSYTVIDIRSKALFFHLYSSVTRLHLENGQLLNLNKSEIIITDTQWHMEKPMKLGLMWLPAFLQDFKIDKQTIVRKAQVKNNAAS